MRELLIKDISICGSFSLGLADGMSEEVRTGVNIDRLSYVLSWNPKQPEMTERQNLYPRREIMVFGTRLRNDISADRIAISKACVRL